MQSNGFNQQDLPSESSDREAQSDLPCQEVVELVTDYLEQTLLAEMRMRVDAHLADCPGCTTYYEQVRQTIDVLHKLAREPMLPRTRDDLLRKFREWRDS